MSEAITGYKQLSIRCVKCQQLCNEATGCNLTGEGFVCDACSDECKKKIEEVNK